MKVHPDVNGDAVSSEVPYSPWSMPDQPPPARSRSLFNHEFPITTSGDGEYSYRRGTTLFVKNGDQHQALPFNPLILYVLNPCDTVNVVRRSPTSSRTHTIMWLLDVSIIGLACRFVGSVFVPTRASSIQPPSAGAALSQVCKKACKDFREAEQKAFQQVFGQSSKPSGSSSRQPPSESQRFSTGVLPFVEEAPPVSSRSRRRSADPARASASSALPVPHPTSVDGMAIDFPIDVPGSDPVEESPFEPRSHPVTDEVDPISRNDLSAPLITDIMPAEPPATASDSGHISVQSAMRGEESSLTGFSSGDVLISENGAVPSAHGSPAPALDALAAIPLPSVVAMTESAGPASHDVAMTDGKALGAHCDLSATAASSGLSLHVPPPASQRFSTRVLPFVGDVPPVNSRRGGSGSSSSSSSRGTRWDVPRPAPVHASALSAPSVPDQTSADGMAIDNPIDASVSNPDQESPREQHSHPSLPLPSVMTTTVCTSISSSGGAGGSCTRSTNSSSHSPAKVTGDADVIISHAASRTGSAAAPATRRIFAADASSHGASRTAGLRLGASMGAGPGFGIVSDSDALKVRSFAPIPRGRAALASGPLSVEQPLTSINVAAFRLEQIGLATALSNLSTHTGFVVNPEEVADLVSISKVSAEDSACGFRCMAFSHCVDTLADSTESAAVCPVKSLFRLVPDKVSQAADKAAVLATRNRHLQTFRQILDKFRADPDFDVRGDQALFESSCESIVQTSLTYLVRQLISVFLPLSHQTWMNDPPEPFSVTTYNFEQELTDIRPQTLIGLQDQLTALKSEVGDEAEFLRRELKHTIGVLQEKLKSGTWQGVSRLKIIESLIADRYPKGFCTDDLFDLGFSNEEATNGRTINGGTLLLEAYRRPVVVVEVYSGPLQISIKAIGVAAPSSPNCPVILYQAGKRQNASSLQRHFDILLPALGDHSRNMLAAMVALGSTTLPLEPAALTSRPLATESASSFDALGDEALPLDPAAASSSPAPNATASAVGAAVALAVGSKAAPAAAQSQNAQQTATGDALRKVFALMFEQDPNKTRGRHVCQSNGRSKFVSVDISQEKQTIQRALQAERSSFALAIPGLHVALDDSDLRSLDLGQHISARVLVNPT